MTQVTLETIKYKDYEIKRWILGDEFYCYNLNNISKSIGVKNARKSVENFDQNEIVSDELRQKYNITTYRKYRNATRKDNKMTLITEQGLKRLLCNSRTPESIEFAKFMNIDVYSYKYFTKESEFIGAIMNSFSTEKFILQYTVPDQITTSYRLDAYLPAHNIAIECDENHHTANEKQDAQRQKIITELINCRWVRFKPDEPDFNIFKVIGEIYSLIHATKK